MTAIEPNNSTREAGVEIAPPAVAEPQPLAPPSTPEAAAFALAQRRAKLLASSDLVPDTYRGNIANCFVAMNMAARMDADPLMVMQNLYIVHGRPGWSSAFLISCFNQCGRFSAMRFEFDGEPDTDSWKCRAYAMERATGERIEGTWITWKMVKAEGWLSRNGSKWQTMPEQMIRYRAAAFFVRAYAPELTMGFHTQEEIVDIAAAEPEPVATPTAPNEPETVDDLVPAEVTVIDPAPYAESDSHEPEPTNDTEMPYTAKMEIEDVLRDQPKDSPVWDVVSRYEAHTNAPWDSLPELANIDENGDEWSLLGLLRDLREALKPKPKAKKKDAPPEDFTKRPMPKHHESKKGKGKE